MSWSRAAFCCNRHVLEFWGRKNAYNVQKVSWMLAELGIDFRHHDVGSRPGDLDEPEFVRLNPHRRVPVIVDGDCVVWESNTILRYLANRYDPDGLLPADPWRRSLVERWMDWELTRLQIDFIDLFWGYYRRPADERDEAAIEDARARCGAAMRQLDRQLEAGDYLAGARFSVADIACGVCLYRYFNLGLPVETPGRLLDWYQRLAARDAYRDTVMLPFDDLRGRSSY